MTINLMFVIANFFNAFLTLALGIFVISKGFKKENIVWFIFCITIFLWGLGIGVVCYAEDYQLADFFLKYIYFVGLIFLAPTFQHFCLTIINEDQKHKIYLIICYIIGLVCIILTFSGNLTKIIFDSPFKFYSGMIYPYYAIFLCLFAWCAIYAFIILFKGLKKFKDNNIKKRQIKVFIVSSIIGYCCGSTAFLPVFGLKVIPAGIFIFGFFNFVITYAIIKYRFMDITTVFHKTLAWLSMSLFIIAPVFFAYYFYNNLFYKLNVFLQTGLLFIIIYSYALFYRYIQPKIDQFFQRAKYNYKDLLVKIHEEFSKTLDLHILINSLGNKLSGTLYVDRYFIGLRKKDEKGFDVYEKDNKAGLNQGIDLDKYKPVFDFIMANKELLEKEQIEIDARFTDIRDEYIKYAGENGIELTVPIILEDEVTGIIGLGKRNNLKSYKIEDIIFLKELGRQIGVYFYNAMHHKDIVDMKNILEQKVLERTRELELALRQKTDFFVNLAHETRTPLTLILNYLDDYIKKQKPSRELDIIKSNFDKLLRDLVNFLDMQKLERGHIFYDHSQAYNIIELLKNKIELFKTSALKKNIMIKSYIKSREAYTNIDLFAVDSILNNILDNAVKYNKPDGNIEIIEYSDKDKIYLNIEDTGIGMSEEQKEHLFKPYHQMFHEKRQIQGLGIGLSIVKMIMNQVNGEIEVESRLDKGTMFKLAFIKCSKNNSMEIPADIELSKPISTEPLALKQEEYDDKKPNVLIVEDNIDFLSFLQNAMSESFNVFYAPDGEEGLKRLAEIPKPDVIIADIMMPNMDGYQFYEEIIKNNIYKAVPFLFLTARSTSEDKLTGLNKGAIDFVTKPVSADVLIAKVNAIIQNQKEHKQFLTEEIGKDIYQYLVSRRGVACNIPTGNTPAGSPEEDVFYRLNREFGITRREIQIIELLEKGLEYKGIGKELDLAMDTIRSHIQKIFKKCGVHNKIELIKLIKK